jgi:hypothetical protein
MDLMWVTDMEIPRLRMRIAMYLQIPTIFQLDYFLTLLNEHKVSEVSEVQRAYAFVPYQVETERECKNIETATQ